MSNGKVNKRREILSQQIRLLFSRFCFHVHPLGASVGVLVLGTDSLKAKGGAGGGGSGDGITVLGNSRGGLRHIRTLLLIICSRPCLVYCMVRWTTIDPLYRPFTLTLFHTLDHTRAVCIPSFHESWDEYYTRSAEPLCMPTLTHSTGRIKGMILTDQRTNFL
jgi:hypothetical protein